MFYAMKKGKQKKTRGTNEQVPLNLPNERIRNFVSDQNL